MRYKTFNATGIAPDGRLYAGDLNGIQDLYLPLSDFTSTVDVGTLRVGDASLQLLKYGAGEFRMSGLLRVDGILRGLGGLLAGAFTTTQRNAIAAGSRPYGMVILNTTTNQYEWNKGTDAVPSWEALGGALPATHGSSHLPGGADPINFAASVNMAGTRAAKPAAASGNSGATYFETDWNQVWRSNGSAWTRVAMFGREVTPAEISGLSAIDGDQILVAISDGVNWKLAYNAAGGTYKWEYLGGPPMYHEITGGSAAQTHYDNLNVVGPYLTLPRAGVYDIEIGAQSTGYSIISDYRSWMSYDIGATPATDADAASLLEDGSRVRRKTFATAGATLTAKYKRTSAQSVNIVDRWMKLVPVNVS